MRAVALLVRFTFTLSISNEIRAHSDANGIGIVPETRHPHERRDQGVPSLTLALPRPAGIP